MDTGSKDTYGIGGRLRELREDKKLSAQVLATQTQHEGITRSVIANIESGRKPDPSVSQVLALADALDVAPIALLAPLATPFEAMPPYGALSRKTVASYLSRVGYPSRSAVPRDARGVLEDSQYMNDLMQADAVLGRVDGAVNLTREWLVPDAHELQEAIRLHRVALGKIARLRGAGVQISSEDLAEAALVAGYTVEVLRLLPELDYGQNDEHFSRSLPPLNPGTGLSFSELEWDMRKASNRDE